MQNSTGAKRRVNWFLLFRFFGILLFILLLFRIDLPQVWECLKKIRLSFLFWALLFQILMLFLKGIRWHILRGERSYPGNFIYNLGTFLESYAMGVITPGRLGELIKAGYERNRNDKWLSVFKIVAERGFDLGFFLTVAGISLAVYDILLLKEWVVFCISFLGLTGIVLSYLLLANKKFKSLTRKFIFKVNRKQTDTINENPDLNWRQTNKVFVLSVLSNVSTFISCYLLAVGVKLHSDLLFTSGAVAVAGILNLLPITVMGLGTREISFLYIFRQFEQPVIMAFSFLMFLTIQIGGGILSLTFGQLLLLYKNAKNRKA